MFKVGDRVSWSSQSGGYWKDKTGEVIEVVAPKSRPSKHIGSTALPRDKESFVVIVGKTTYYPVASKLKAVK